MSLYKVNKYKDTSMFTSRLGLHTQCSPKNPAVDCQCGWLAIVFVWG